MKKKLALTALSSVLALGVLAACGDGGENGNDPTMDNNGGMNEEMNNDGMENDGMENEEMDNNDGDA
ncbi:hypothetical protein [Salipaludibacillus aurantiacus]|uniref:Uncharacterized protein n=1 Tax=Salipaludibacillus aurantiacus TaxID=1601833 RepID=A0A1H9VE58_9BACI|nr:hypothetical protein [Salipaludibacillus aurantiacus]SES20080.1 hypothetical protein SAMN05518684_110141 [Salipaludibacillus aurantiacus]